MTQSELRQPEGANAVQTILLHLPTPLKASISLELSHITCSPQVIICQNGNIKVQSLCSNSGQRQRVNPKLDFLMGLPEVLLKSALETPFLEHR